MEKCEKERRKIGKIPKQKKYKQKKKKNKKKKQLIKK